MSEPSFVHGHRDMRAALKAKVGFKLPMDAYFVDRGESQVCTIHCDIESLRFIVDSLPHNDYMTGQLDAVLEFAEALNDVPKVR